MYFLGQIWHVWYGKSSKISNTGCLPTGKQSRQTVQTQIRLLLKKHSDQGLPCLLFSQAFCEFQPWNLHFIWEKKKKKVGNLRTFTIHSVLVSLFFTSQSTIFQVSWHRFSWVESALSKDHCVLLKDTRQWRGWGLNLHPWSRVNHHWATAPLF